MELSLSEKLSTDAHSHPRSVVVPCTNCLASLEVGAWKNIEYRFTLWEIGSLVVEKYGYCWVADPPPPQQVGG